MNLDGEGSGEWLVKSQRKRPPQKKRADDTTGAVTSAPANVNSPVKSLQEHRRSVGMRGGIVQPAHEHESLPWSRIPLAVTSKCDQETTGQFLQNIPVGQRFSNITASSSKQSFTQKAWSGNCFISEVYQHVGHSPGSLECGNNSSKATGPCREMKDPVHDRGTRPNSQANDKSLSLVSSDQDNILQGCHKAFGLGSQSGDTRYSNMQTSNNTKKRRSVKKDTLRTKLPPQDSRICIIDKSLKEKWMQSELVKPAVLKRSVPLHEKDFPDLTLALKRHPKYVGNTLDQLLESSTEEADPGVSSSVPLRCHKLQTKESQKKKQPRRKDPISVNILDIIKDLSGPSNHKHTAIHVPKTQSSKYADKWRIGGNLLDSSNPIRKRGKHREGTPKKRISKLKVVILNERQKKQRQRDAILNIMRGAATDSKDLVAEEESLSAVLSSLCIEGNVSGSEESQEENIKHEVNELLCDNAHDNSFLCDKKDCDDVEKCVIYTNQEEKQGLLKSSSNALKLDKNLTNDSDSHHEFVGISTSAVEQETFETDCDINRPQLALALHSRKFREYCDNMRSSDLDEATTNLLREIYRFQDRHYQKEPIRAHAKRRFVLGFREVKKFLLLRKLKAIVVAPDLEPVKSPGGLDETVRQVKEEGRLQQIPVIFAVGRRQLGFALKKKVPISIVGIINPEGAEELYKSMLEKWRVASKMYEQKVLELSKTFK